MSHVIQTVACGAGTLSYGRQFYDSLAVALIYAGRHLEYRGDVPYLRNLNVYRVSSVLIVRMQRSIKRDGKHYKNPMHNVTVFKQVAHQRDISGSYAHIADAVNGLTINANGREVIDFLTKRMRPPPTPSVAKAKKEADE